MKHIVITVRLWGMEVGRLQWDSRRGNSVFAYSTDFLNSGYDIAPLSNSTRTMEARLPVWGNREKLYGGLPPFIADSLPDNWGNKVFEQWALENGLRRHDITPLEKLAYIGKRGMGALEFEPHVGPNGNDEALHIERLTELATKIYRQRENTGIVLDDSLTMQSLFEVGTSAGGRQAKAIIAINGETGEVRSGQAKSDSTFKHYILKFDMDYEYCYPATLLEMVYYEMAVAAGIRIMPSKLLEVEGRRHFLTERFDRKGENKIHVQTLAAINPLAERYEDLFKTARKINVAKSEIIALFRQTVFNFLAGNTDDHNKNFSFTMGRDGVWHLAPAYDLTFTWRSPQSEYPHCLSLRGRTDGKDILKELSDFARDEGIPAPDRIIYQVAEAICSFRLLCEKYKVPSFWTDFIEESLHELAPESYKEKLSGWQNGKVPSYHEYAHHIENARLELSERGNLHLYATIDGKEMKYIISKDSETVHDILSGESSENSPQTIKKLVSKFLLPKIASRCDRL